MEVEQQQRLGPEINMSGSILFIDAGSREPGFLLNVQQRRGLTEDTAQHMLNHE